jgi:hypothetical protein
LKNHSTDYALYSAKRIKPFKWEEGQGAAAPALSAHLPSNPFMGRESWTFVPAKCRKSELVILGEANFLVLNDLWLQRIFCGVSKKQLYGT